MMYFKSISGWTRSLPLKSITLVGFTLLILTPVAVNASSAEHSTLQTRDDTDVDCATQRSSDYYGLGVRLGIYFAWLTSYIANIALPEEVAGALDTNAIFLFALLVAMIRCSMTGMLEQLDGLLLMQLSSGTIFGVLSLWGYRTCQYHIDGPKAIRHFGGLGTHMRLLLCMAISTFGLWFWMDGVDDGLSNIPNDPKFTQECSVLYTFMFTKVRAKGGIRTLYIIICISCMLYFGVMILASSLAGWSRVSKIVTLIKRRQWASTTRLRFATGLNMKELRISFNALRILNLFWLIFSAVMVEFTLNYNQVKGVLGENGDVSLPSQIIPLLIGAFGFARILWILFKEWRSPGDTDPSIAGDPSPPAEPTTPLPSGLALLKVFSPALNTSSVDTAAEHEDSEIDPLVDHHPRWQRYLVAILPWLSLTNWWTNSENKRWEKLPMSFKDHNENQFTRTDAQQDTPSIRVQSPHNVRTQDGDEHLEQSRRRETWESISTKEDGDADPKQEDE